MSGPGDFNAARLALRWACACAAMLAAGSAFAEAPAPRQSRDDAWWTGSLLAPSANTLPTGHMLVETYVFDSRPYGRIDDHGHLHDVPRDNNYGSLTYLNYGLTDDVTVGMVPHFGYARPVHGRGSSGIGVGDVTLQAQYRLTQFREGGRMPTIAVNIQESLPIGRHDRLDGRPNDGFGSGAYATTLALYSQTFLWTPNGRILRTRLDFAYTIADRAQLKGMNVYGTPAGFRGHADPGDSFNVDLAFEYSVTKEWVLAMDIAWQRDAATSVLGTYTPAGAGAPVAFQARSRASEALILAPAVEYSWTPNLGVIVGARIVPAGRNTTASVTPAIAINYVR